MEIGRIVKSNSHVDYVAQVYGPGETAAPPQADDYGFGQFMLIHAEPGRALVAAVYDTQLLNPEFGRLGPRLSSPQDTAVFAPDYLCEQAVLVGLVVLGQRMDGVFEQGIPRASAGVNAPVQKMLNEEFIGFHRYSETPALHYARILQAQGKPLLFELLEQIAGRLELAFPEKSTALRTLRANLMWQSRVQVNR